MILPLRIGAVKSEDDGDASASEKEMDDLGEACPSKRPIKGKRKLQTRKGSKLLQLQAKTASDSESDTGIKKDWFKIRELLCDKLLYLQLKICLYLILLYRFFLLIYLSLFYYHFYFLKRIFIYFFASVFFGCT